MKLKLKRFFVFLIWCFGFFIVFVLLTNLIVFFRAKPYIYKSLNDVSAAQVVLIPGAAILKNGEPSSIFKDRVNIAIELYQTKKVSKILVSGGDSAISHNEVNPVYNYLLKNNIPKEDIFLDHAGFDTYSTMYRARDIFKVSSVVVSTQSFHLPRAIFVARMLGIEAYGISADNGNILLKNYVREIFANEKAVFNLIFQIKPKFLGEAIPII
ncbi:MAG: ElyC/SanA/YdcF family protein [bacterium]